MSRIGKQPIDIPGDVTIDISDSLVLVKGPKGELSQEILPGIELAIEDNQVVVTRAEQTRSARAFHGLMRSLINNMVIGVRTGFSKVLEMVGVGYRAQVQGQDLNLSVGFSHPVNISAPEGITFNVENNTIITVQGIDKQLVGQVAANIRSIRKPEPYKGKGIKYQNETIIRKAGKTAASTA